MQNKEQMLKNKLKYLKHLMILEKSNLELTEKKVRLHGEGGRLTLSSIFLFQKKFIDLLYYLVSLQLGTMDTFVGGWLVLLHLEVK